MLVAEFTTGLRPADEPLHSTTEFDVKPRPVSKSGNADEAPPFVQLAESELSAKPGVPLSAGSVTSQAPRPCVAARSMREASWSVSANTGTFGIPPASKDHEAPPFAVKNTPE